MINKKTMPSLENLILHLIPEVLVCIVLDLKACATGNDTGDASPASAIQQLKQKQ